MRQELPGSNSTLFQPRCESASRYNPEAAAKSADKERAKESEFARLTSEQRKKIMEKRAAIRAAANEQGEQANTEKAIRALEVRIRNLELGIAKTEADAHYTVERRMSDGTVQTESRINKSKVNKAAYYRKRADREQLKIDEADSLVTR
ncbi:MAG: hypothetical protein VCA73_18980 [Roseibacillus sp.]|jgi:hypothetical protein